MCHKDYDIESLTKAEELQIEAIVQRYNQKVRMNKSNILQIIYAMKLGAIRGFVSGIIFNGTIFSGVLGAFSIGTINGVITSNELKYTNNQFIHENKHT